MYKSILFLLLVILCGSAIPARAAPPAQFQPPLDPDKMGLVIRDPWYDFGTELYQPNEPNRAAQDRMGEMLEQLGVRWVRFEFQIAGSSEAEVISQIARNDYFINEVAPRHNLKVLGLLGFNLIRGRSVFDLNSTAFLPEDEQPYGGGVNEYMRVWLDRARLITNRYGDRIDAYQILNEQNRMSDDGAIDAEVTARLLTKFYRFFRHEDSALPGEQDWREDVQIILGGLHPAGTSRPWLPGYVSDREYLLDIYAADGFQSYRETYGDFPIDGLGYHPYPEEIITLQDDIALIRGRIDEVRETLVEVGDPLLPFWITEIGYNVAFGSQDEVGQAEFMRDVFRELGTRPDVAVVFWFKYEDFPPASGPNAQKWGVVRIPFTMGNCAGGACYDRLGRPTELRPSFWTYRELAGRGDAQPEPPAQVTMAISQTDELELNTTYTVTATVSRDTATRPISYSWLIDGALVRQSTGTLTDTLTFQGRSLGAYEIQVEATNEAGVVMNSQPVYVGRRVFLPVILR